jgi:hypothetical protein
MQGIAGSLAGIAALGAVGASAKKKKKSSKGTLVRVEIVEVTDSVPVSSVAPVDALCDAPGGKENVFVLGGGFKPDPATSDLFVIKASGPTTSGGEQGWVIEAENTDNMVEIDVTAFAICGYFRKK